MSDSTPFRLNKSRFLAGRQCHLRFWMEEHHPDLADPVEAEDQYIIDQGIRVGELARGLPLDGVTVDHESRSHEDVVLETQRLLADPSVPAIMEAGLEARGEDVRVDMIERNDDGTFDLLEVKAVSRPTQRHIEDLAFQVMVAEAAGLQIRGAFVLHPDADYVFDGVDMDPQSYFQRTDVTDAVRAEIVAVQNETARLHTLAQSPNGPVEPIGPQCNKPHRCPFHGHCHRTVTADHVENIAHISNKLRGKLKEAGITDIRHIPDDWELSKHQQRWVDMVKTGQTIRDDAGFLSDLGGLEFPVHFFDFEAVNPALPLWPGHQPYEITPFQFSDHVLFADGRLEHLEYLHRSPDEDPDEKMLEAQYRALGDKGTIVAFSAYEPQRWRDYAKRHPAWASYMQELQDRYLDLHPVIKRNFAHPELRGSYSLKAIYGVLLPGLSYDDLAIRNGSQAVVAYEELLGMERQAALGDEEARERADEIADHLLQYCGRDTQAMLELVAELRPDLRALMESRTVARGRRGGRT